MIILFDVWEGVLVFLRKGGPVLQYAIVPVLVLMWVLLIERFWYLASGQQEDADALVETWKNRQDRDSWGAQAIRNELMAIGSSKIRARTSIIDTCIVLCPLLGLLGTVTGMIEVFHIMAVTGGGDARAMAGGVSRATLPTLSGMVGAVSGVFAMQIFLRDLMRRAERNLETALYADRAIPGG